MLGERNGGVDGGSQDLSELSAGLGPRVQILVSLLVVIVIRVLVIGRSPTEFEDQLEGLVGQREDRLA